MEVKGRLVGVSSSTVWVRPVGLVSDTVSKKTTCLNEPSVEGSINEQSTDDAFPKGRVSQCDSVSY